MITFTVGDGSPRAAARGGRARLIVVSNRVPAPGDVPAGAGGLVSALLPALEASGGMWFGWSGRVGDVDAPSRVARAGGVEYVTVDLSADELVRYYEGFANGTLWPVLHHLNHRVHADDAVEYAAWRAVSRRFAARLLPLLRPGDLVFVQDYHLIPLGAELRRLGWGGHVGYFHHVPVPPRDGWTQLPHHEEIARLFDAYDLAGVQTTRDAARLADVLGPAAGCRIGVHPIGIDPHLVRAMASGEAHDAFAPVRAAGPVATASPRIFFGVDRLDYTKGIPWRLVAYEQFLQRDGARAWQTRFVQWAAPSRETIAAYRAERAAVESLAARINATFAPAAPVALTCADRPRAAVAAALRDADVCVVTSLADGMNLVAKEFVAVQAPADPGVLILSDSCGAADELDGALLVRATNVSSIVAAMERAAAMARVERVERWRRMRAAVEANTAGRWLAGFLRALVSPRTVSTLPAAREAAAALEA